MQGANNGIKPPILFAAFYSALSRSLFCACLAYLIVCFLCGKLQTLNTLLSFYLVRPLSRVSYAAYLLHPIIIAAFYGSREEVFHFSHYLMVNIFFLFNRFNMINLICFLCCLNYSFTLSLAICLSLTFALFWYQFVLKCPSLISVD